MPWEADATPSRTRQTALVLLAAVVSGPPVFFLLAPVLSILTFVVAPALASAGAGLVAARLAPANSRYIGIIAALLAPYLSLAVPNAFLSSGGHETWAEELALHALFIVGAGVALLLFGLAGVTWDQFGAREIGPPGDCRTEAIDSPTERGLYALLC